jgi:hypothetical protein
MPDISALERVMSPVKGMGMTAVSAGGGVIIGSCVAVGVRDGWTVGDVVGEMTESCSGGSIGWGVPEPDWQLAAKMMTAVINAKKHTR